MKKVLVIDDCENDLLTFNNLLETIIPNCKVFLAESGKKGLDIAKSKSPDVIILDIVMPVMDGFEVCKILKADEKTRNIPIIILSANYFDTNIKVKSLKLGADVFLSKPINNSEFSAQVNSMLRIKAAEDQLRNEKSVLEKLVAERIKQYHESEAKFQSFMDTAKDLMFISDKDSNINYVNKAGIEVLGYSEEEFKKMSLTQIFTKDALENNFQQNRDKLIKEGEIVIDTTLKTHKNKEIHGTLNTVAIFDDDGKFTGCRTVFHNLNERIYSEKIHKVLYDISNAVNTSENLNILISYIKEQLDTVIDTTNFYVALYDSEKDEFNVPFFVDERINVKTFPASKSMTAYVFKTKKPILAKESDFQRLEKEGKLEMFGVRSKVWLGVPLIGKENVIGVLATQSYNNQNAYNINDMKVLEIASHQISISIERKQVEDNLKLALEKAEESDRLKSVFLSTMSHELRTPLNAIIGFSELIDENTPLDSIIDFTKTINDGGNHLLEIVEDIFDVTLILSGEIKINKKEFDLDFFMEEIFKSAKNEKEKIDNKNIDLRFKKPQNETKLKLFTDFNKLKQIFINLIINALKFTHQGFVECGYFIETIDGNLMLKFYVKDTGIGIAKEKQNLIFEVFRQADDSHTRKYEGTGVGLTISKKLTEIFGGNISVDSEEGIGSTFTFSIPYEKLKE
ncbi:MAG: response regulator [Bacteroidales bacterium]|nr:response regulator [Bacteroidales bacterium]